MAGFRRAFGAPVTLSTPAQGIDNVRYAAAVAPNGTITVVWIRYDGTDAVVQSASRPAGGSFSSPVTVAPTFADGEPTTPAAVAAPDGTVTAVWNAGNQSSYVLKAATRAAAGSWGAPVTVSPTAVYQGGPQLGAAADGTVTLVWLRVNGTGYQAMVATRPPGGAFSAPSVLSPAGTSALDVDLGVAPDGTTTAIWSATTHPVNRAAVAVTRGVVADWMVQTATRPPGGAFGAVTHLDDAAMGSGLGAPDAGIAPDAIATAVWTGFDGTNPVVKSASTGLPKYALTVTRSGAGGGTVTSSPAGIDCGAGCSASFTEGTVVTLTATPAAGSAFTRWVGCTPVAGKPRQCTVKIEAAASARAVFAVTPVVGHVTLTPSSIVQGTGSVVLTFTSNVAGTASITTSPCSSACTSASAATTKTVKAGRTKVRIRTGSLHHGHYRVKVRVRSHGLTSHTGSAVLTVRARRPHFTG